jgi:hypothetical protein
MAGRIQGSILCQTVYLTSTIVLINRTQLPRNQNKGKRTAMEIFEKEFFKEKAKLAVMKDMDMNL